MEHPVVTVLGGTGCLGGAIVASLAGAGYRVRVASRGATGHSDNTRLEPCQADIRDRRSLERAFTGATAVVNAVSLYAEKRGLSFDDIHVRGARNAAEMAAQCGATRLLHVSGIGADTTSTSKYVRARAEGEAAVQSAFPDATILRPSVLFGPGTDFLSSLELATRLPVVPLFGRGHTRLQPVHVADIAAAVPACLEKDHSAGRTYELGGAGIYRYRDIVATVAERLGRRRLLMPFPFVLWKTVAALLSPLPDPPLTRDQVILMESDNVVAQSAHNFTELGVEPVSLNRWLRENGR